MKLSADASQSLTARFAAPVNPVFVPGSMRRTLSGRALANLAEASGGPLSMTHKSTMTSVLAINDFTVDAHHSGASQWIT